MTDDVEYPNRPSSDFFPPILSAFSADDLDSHRTHVISARCLDVQHTLSDGSVFSTRMNSAACEKSYYGVKTSQDRIPVLMEKSAAAIASTVGVGGSSTMKSLIIDRKIYRDHSRDPREGIVDAMSSEKLPEIVFL